MQPPIGRKIHLPEKKELKKYDASRLTGCIVMAICLSYEVNKEVY